MINLLKISLIIGILAKLFIFQNVYSTEILSDIDYEQVAREAKHFRPHSFWSQPIERQLLYLSDSIRQNNLQQIVCDKRKDFSPLVELEYDAYSAQEGTVFCKAVWHGLQKYIKDNDIKLTEHEFIQSLKIGIPADSYVYEAPLIYHFENYLCKRYDKQFRELPSMFEELMKDKI